MPDITVLSMHSSNGRVPTNLTFEVEDLEAEWLYRPGTYDLIHVRFMFLAIKDYPAMLAQAYK
jgi:hypothetical protein